MVYKVLNDWGRCARIHRQTLTVLCPNSHFSYYSNHERPSFHSCLMG